MRMEVGRYIVRERLAIMVSNSIGTDNPTRRAAGDRFYAEVCRVAIMELEINVENRCNRRWSKTEWTKVANIMSLKFVCWLNGDQIVLIVVSVNNAMCNAQESNLIA